MRLIDADALLEAYDKAHKGPPGAARRLIEAAPTIEAAGITIYAPDNHFDAVLISAVRYCIGRRTYMPELVARWIMGHCAGRLEKSTYEIMRRDIDSARNLGEECDVQAWMRFRTWLVREAEASE